MPQTMTPARRRLYAGLSVVLGTVVALGIGELWIRKAPPPPHRQVIRTRGLTEIGDTPVWAQTNDREHFACVRKFPDRTRILFAGSSVTYGAGLDESETFTTLLEKRLNELRPDPGFCVLSLAQPGFAFGQKLATAQEYVPKYRPALIMWEDWRYEWGHYRLIGDAAFYLREFKLRDDGFPGLVVVPDGLNHWAFLNSRLYQWITLAAGQLRDLPADEVQGATFASEDMPKVEALARSVNAKLVVYLATGLDQPFQTPTPTLDLHWQQPIDDLGHRDGFPVHWLQRELVGQNYLDIRLDPCCHFNAKGHRVLEPIFEKMVLEALDSGRSHPG